MCACPRGLPWSFLFRCLVSGPAPFCSYPTVINENPDLQECELIAADLTLYGDVQNPASVTPSCPQPQHFPLPRISITIGSWVEFWLRSSPSCWRPPHCTSRHATHAQATEDPSVECRPSCCGWRFWLGDNSPSCVSKAPACQQMLSTCKCLWICPLALLSWLTLFNMRPRTPFPKISRKLYLTMCPLKIRPFMCCHTSWLQRDHFMRVSISIERYSWCAVASKTPDDEPGNVLGWHGWTTRLIAHGESNDLKMFSNAKYRCWSCPSYSRLAHDGHLF